VAARAWAQAAPELNLIRGLVALNLALGTGVFVLACAGRVL
jgi:ubiquinone/menaquinone biosynthesis C-methylase UbiE